LFCNAESYLLVTILAAALGCVDPFGGFGRVLGLLLSLLLLHVISTGFNLLGYSPYLTTAIWGITMILAIPDRSSSRSVAGALPTAFAG